MGGPLVSDPEKPWKLYVYLGGIVIGGSIVFFCCAMGLIRCFCPDVDCGEDDGTSSEFETHSSGGGGGGGSGEGGDGGDGG